ncbi:MAG TPA: zinc ABC transporter substrate-binding protein [Rhodospirillaceae bacterium]|nr:zinc ABC transporter substrate-binding protein [Rhodospirillaceae bacterium]|tara:strand:- start:1116 stop:2030 length:915 start_codon:yes stop_codon:yes gene_type:complete
MRKTTLALLLAVWGVTFSSPAAADLKVFACEPEWAALARDVGGDKVDAYSATHARQDPHHIRAKPSLIARIRRADMVFCSGADLEVGWLPLLLQRGARAGVQPGTTGHLMAAEQVPVLEKPAVVDRSLGDVHPGGNPHVHLNPENILIIATELGKRMMALDPENAAHYRNRMASFSKSWRAAMDRWKHRTAKLSGMPVIVHHKSFSYLFDWMGLKEVATLEVKPGIPPTVSHLNGLLRTAKSVNVKTILRAPYDPSDGADWLSAKTGIPQVELPYTVERNAPAGALINLFDRTITLLEGAHAGS